MSTSLFTCHNSFACLHNACSHTKPYIANRQARKKSACHGKQQMKHVCSQLHQRARAFFLHSCPHTQSSVSGARTTFITALDLGLRLAMVSWCFLSSRSISQFLITYIQNQRSYRQETHIFGISKSRCVGGRT